MSFCELCYDIEETFELWGIKRMCSENFVGHFGYLSNFIKWNVAGVPDTMLYFGLFCCGGLPAFPLEHRWHVDHNCLLWKHSVAILHPCLSRGIHCWFLLLSYLFMSRVSGFYSSFFMRGVFLVSRKRSFLCWWQLPHLRGLHLVLYLI